MYLIIFIKNIKKKIQCVCCDFINFWTYEILYTLSFRGYTYRQRYAVLSIEIAENIFDFFETWKRLDKQVFYYCILPFSYIFFGVYVYFDFLLYNFYYFHFFIEYIIKSYFELIVSSILKYLVIDGIESFELDPGSNDYDILYHDSFIYFSKNVMGLKHMNPTYFDCIRYPFKTTHYEIIDDMQNAQPKIQKSLYALHKNCGMGGMIYLKNKNGDTVYNSHFAYRFLDGEQSYVLFKRTFGVGDNMWWSWKNIQIAAKDYAEAETQRLYEKSALRSFNLWYSDYYINRNKIYEKMIFTRRYFTPMNVPYRDKLPYLIKLFEFDCGYFDKQSIYHSSYHHYLIADLVDKGFIKKDWVKPKLSNELAPEVLLTLKLGGDGILNFNIKTNNDLNFYRYMENTYGTSRKELYHFSYLSKPSNQPLAAFKMHHRRNTLMEELVRHSYFVEVWEKTINYKPIWEPDRWKLDHPILYDVKPFKFNMMAPELEKWPSHISKAILSKHMSLKKAYQSEEEVFNLYIEKSEWDFLDFLIKLFFLPNDDCLIYELKKWINNQYTFTQNFQNGDITYSNPDFYKRLCVVIRDILLYENSKSMLLGKGRSCLEDPVLYTFTFQDVVLNWYRLGIINYDQLIETYNTNWHFDNKLELYRQLQHDIIKFLKYNAFPKTDIRKFDIFFSFKIPNLDYSWSNGNCSVIFYREDGAPPYWVWGHEKCKIYVMDYKGGYPIEINSKDNWNTNLVFLRRGFHPAKYPVMNSIAHYYKGTSHPLMPTGFYHQDFYPYNQLFSSDDPIFVKSYVIEKKLIYTKQELDNIIEQRIQQKYIEFHNTIRKRIVNCIKTLFFIKE